MTDHSLSLREKKQMQKKTISVNLKTKRNSNSKNTTTTTTTTTPAKLDTIQVLNRLYAEKKSQLESNANSILTKARIENELVKVFGLGPCLVSTQSLDGRGRAQRAMRVPAFTNGKDKVNFRPWHVTWINANGPAPLGKQYSHRCHVENCVQHMHGTWEPDKDNKDRWSCRGCSHLILPDDRVIRICPHEPCCVRPLKIDSWDDQRFVQLPAI